ncbi:hypothetical protein [Pelagibius sp. 7325]|uniref:hypothetical protein n=1 Tax=Pelagibius sp. 7325 TaxID=3131994 RepID=UPI0030ECAE6A
MRRRLLRHFSAILLATAVLVLPALPANACMINERYEPDKPFYEHFFNGAMVIFRGYPIAYRHPEPSGQTVFSDRVEITFSVSETYQGEQRNNWTAVWITTAFSKPVDLVTFKQEIGDDLVVVLAESSNVVAIKFGDLPFVAHENCGQPGMRSYAVMEPVLRSRKLID